MFISNEITHGAMSSMLPHMDKSSLPLHQCMQLVNQSIVCIQAHQSVEDVCFCSISPRQKVHFDFVWSLCTSVISSIRHTISHWTGMHAVSVLSSLVPRPGGGAWVRGYVLSTLMNESSKHRVAKRSTLYKKKMDTIEKHKHVL